MAERASATITAAQLPSGDARVHGHPRRHPAPRRSTHSGLRGFRDKDLDGMPSSVTAPAGGRDITNAGSNGRGLPSMVASSPASAFQWELGAPKIGF